MAGKTYGIEVGNDTLKVTEVVGGVVRRSICKELPDNLVLEGQITSMDAMTNLLKEVRKEHHLGSGNAALVLPYHGVITNSITMPPMSDQELALNLPFEFRDYVGTDGDKYYYDYAVMATENDAQGQPEKLELFSAAVPKAMIDSHYDMLKKAGFTMKVAIPHEMAWLNLVRKATSEPKELCIIDMGHTATRLYIFADGRFVMGREIEIGGLMLDAVIAEKNRVDSHIAREYKESNFNNVATDEGCLEVYNDLAIEIMKAINFYNNYNNRNANLQDLYFCGGQSVIEELRTAIKKNVGLTMHHICRLVPGGVENDETLSCALSAGAAIQ